MSNFLRKKDRGRFNLAHKYFCRGMLFLTLRTTLMSSKNAQVSRAVVVAQLVEWLLPTPEVCGSNAIIGIKITYLWLTVEKMKIKKKVITCKISRWIDLRYGTKNKISLPVIENIRASVEFHYRTVPFRIFGVFLRKF